MLADYVTLDAGTGAVHTAPGHGADDFITGQKYGLEIYAPVGPGGHFLDTVELFAGQRVWDANASVEQELKQRSRLLHRSNFSHQYPHCWRCHNPVIFLATSQWFIRMDGDPRSATDGTHAAPGGTRRDRQRREVDSGVGPRPHLQHGEQPARLVHLAPARLGRAHSRGRLHEVRRGDARRPTLVDKAAAVFDTYGADAWYERPIEEFLPDGLACPSCGGTSFERERDILDVWFDSGSSHEAVLPRVARPDVAGRTCTSRAATSTAAGSRARCSSASARAAAPPYREVLTHGFLIDLEGRKMSKSVGNVISPQNVIKESGAEILRLWVAMCDYAEELRVGKEILARVVESYRKIRNTLRYLVSNLYDFDPARDRVPRRQLEEVDRYMLARYGEVARRILKAYDEYDYPTIFQTLNAFMSVDLSAFYSDISKDRLYTFAARSRERRSAQTAMYVDGGRVRAAARADSARHGRAVVDAPAEARSARNRCTSRCSRAQADLDAFVDRQLLDAWERLLRHPRRP